MAASSFGFQIIGRQMRHGLSPHSVVLNTFNSMPDRALSTALQNKVTIIPGRHSRMLLAGIQKKSLDARLRGHDRWISDTHLCGHVLSQVDHAAGGPSQQFIPNTPATAVLVSVSNTGGGSVSTSILILDKPGMSTCRRHTRYEMALNGQSQSRGVCNRCHLPSGFGVGHSSAGLRFGSCSRRTSRCGKGMLMPAARSAS